MLDVLKVLPIVGLVLLPAVIFLLNRKRISRWMDERQIRPSLINGCMQLIYGLLFSITMFWVSSEQLIGFIPFLIIYGFWIANGLDKMIGKPEQEVRPHWYVGAGAPSWIAPSEAKFSFRFSLRWLICLTLVFCAFTARFALIWNQRQLENRRNREGIQTAIDLGATVHNDLIVSFNRNPHLKDSDLAFLSALSTTQDLDLSNTRITNEALRHVARMPNLRSLDVSGCR